jgi:probable HAF family extracellular repeat protein
MKSQSPTLTAEPLSAFRSSKTIRALSCALVLGSLPVTLFAGKPAPPPPPNYPYTLRQLDLPSGAVSVEHNGLNNLGRIVGRASFQTQFGQDEFGCVWEPSGQTVLLPSLSTAEIRRAGAGWISDSGLITGSSVTYLGSGGIYYDNIRATFWENISGAFQARDWNDLMPFELGIHLLRTRLSSDGQYIAFEGQERQTGTAATVIAQVLYGETGNVTGLSVLDVLMNTWPHDINHDGAGVVRVLGSTVGSGGGFYFLWKRAGIDTSLKVAPDVEAMSPLLGKVNKFGQVANTHRYAPYTSTALLWEETQLWDLAPQLPQLPPLNLGTLGGTSASARCINDLSQVVGTATLGGRRAEDRAFLWNNGTLLDLNSLAPVGQVVLRYANRINNRGQILAGAEGSRSSYVGVLLTPVVP